MYKNHVTPYSDYDPPTKLESRLNTELVKARKILGLTLNEAEKIMNITRLSAIESMRIYPSRERQAKICNFYRKNGIQMFEEDVFPEELKNFNVELYIPEGDIPREDLVPLSDVHERMLPWANNTKDGLEVPKLIDEVYEMIGFLSPREQRIIEMRYGLDGKGERTLLNIGRELEGLSQERIRQIEKKAMKKLRHPRISGHLRKYWPQHIRKI